MSTALLVALALAATAPKPPLVADWSVKLPEWHGRTLVLAANDESVFFDAEDSIHQLSLSSGKLLRKYKKEEGCQTVIDIQLVGNFAAFLCEYPRSESRMSREIHSVLSVVDMKSGATPWTRPGVIPAIAHSDDKLFVIDGDSVVALDIKSGKEIWKSNESGPSHIAIGEGVLIAVQANRATALQPDTGQALWTAKLSGVPRAEPLVHSGLVFVSMLEAGDKGFGSALAALSAKDGKSQWQKEFPQESAFFPAFAVGDGVGLYTMNEDPPPGALRTFSMSGEPRWVAPLRSDANGHDFRAALSGNSIFDWTRDDKSKSGGEYQLAKVEMKTGKVEWLFPVSGDEKYLLSRILIRGDRLLYSNMSRIYGMRMPREK